MIVGLDFDNTIISYKSIFYNIARKKKLIPHNIKKDKKSVKDYLISKNLEEEWTKIQSDAYGLEINKAKPFQYLIEFLKELKKIDATIYIISHKTKYPYLGKKTNLRKSALKWIQKNNIIKYIPKKNIFFEETINKKIKRIKSLKCNFYVDDLPLILNLLPNKVVKILFDPKKNNNIYSYNTSCSWNQIKSYILNYNKFTKLLTNNSLNHLNIIQGRNNKVYSISNNRTNYFIKKYKKDNNRQEREIIFLKYLEKRKLNKSNKIIHYDLLNKTSIYSFIKGTKISRIKKLYLDDCVNFIYLINKDLNHNNISFKFAVDYCKSINSHIKSIKKRLDAIIDKKNSNLLKDKHKFFFQSKILPIFKHKLINIKQKYKLSDLNKIKESSEYILSPSDYGFHNIIENNDKIYYVDFEYSGLDDPHKLILDFLCQPDLQLNSSQTNYFLHEITDKLSSFKISKDLLNYLEPFYRIKWCCIILNKYVNKISNSKLSQNYLASLNSDFFKVESYYKKYLLLK